MTAFIPRDAIQPFVEAWFHALDVHAPPGECLKLLAADGLRMRFPEGELSGTVAFLKWYDRVVNLFFDERHTIQRLELLAADEASTAIDVRVRWQSEWWAPPEPTSKHIDLEVGQQWRIRRCSREKNALGLEIVEYFVSDDIAYAPGSAVLSHASPPDPADLTALNRKIAEMEQEGGEAGRRFFDALLSDELVFRRVSGKTVGKAGSDGFMAGLSKNPFVSRRSEDLSVVQVGDRALVTLVVVAAHADDASIHRYRNIRLFSRRANAWMLEFWYNYEITGL